MVEGLRVSSRSRLIHHGPVKSGDEVGALSGGRAEGGRRQPVPDFDRLARPYRYLEYLTFGTALEDTRLHFLPNLGDRRLALVLGDGDGRFTARLMRANPYIRVHAVDASSRMLAALRNRAKAHEGRLETEAADLRMWGPGEGIEYDLVVSHFMLDCLTTGEIEALASRLKPSLSPDAQWVVSDFAIPSNRFGTFVAGPMVAFLYCAFRILTGLKASRLPNHVRALENADWVIESQKGRLRGLLISQLWHRNNQSSSK